MKVITILLKIGTLSLLVYGLLFTSITQAEEGFAVISQSDFIVLSKQPDTQIIDIRTPREYQRGHIPNAINLPHKDILSGAVNFDTLIGKTLIIYCHTGYRVSIIEKYLGKNPGFPRTDILRLQGDFRAWQARGRPINKPPISM